MVVYTLQMELNENGEVAIPQRDSKRFWYVMQILYGLSATCLIICAIIYFCSNLDEGAYYLEKGLNLMSKIKTFKCKNYNISNTTG